MKVFVIIIFLFSFHLSHGQSLQKYFEHIYQAEDALLDSNFSKASQFYQLAFKIEDGLVFLKDVHNALLASNLAVDSTKFFFFAELMVTFDTKHIIPNYEGKLNPFFFQYLHSLESNFQEIPGHCNFFKKLKALDQALRKACIEEGVYPLCVEEIRILDSINLQSVIRYLTNHVLIKEVNRCKMNPTLFSPLHLVILHNSQTKDTLIFKYLLEEVHKGRIHPQEYAYLIARFKKDELENFKDYAALDYHIVIMDRLFVFVPDLDNKKEYNARRKYIFLDDLENFHRKLAYQFFHPNGFYFVYPNFISRLGGGVIYRMN